MNIFNAKYIFVCFILVVAQAYENILTTKISRFTVRHDKAYTREMLKVLHI